MIDNFDLNNKAPKHGMANFDVINQPEQYSHPVAMCIREFGHLLVVDYNPVTQTSTLLDVCLHSPADVYVLVKDIQDT